ncbi:MAG: hypothetical protein AB8G16_00530 [Gammaproteobacteria bacterium]
MLGVVTAQALVTAGAVYVLIGFLIALPFVLRGAGAIDPSAAQGSIGFKLAILPGCIALWPLIVVLWRRGRGLSEHNAHRDRAPTTS